MKWFFNCDSKLLARLRNASFLAMIAAFFIAASTYPQSQKKAVQLTTEQPHPKNNHPTLSEDISSTYWGLSVERNDVSVKGK